MTIITIAAVGYVLVAAAVAIKLKKFETKSHPIASYM